MKLAIKAREIPFTLQITTLAVVAMFAACAAIYTTLSKIRAADELTLARSTADMAESLRQLVQSHGSHYVRLDYGDDLAMVGKYLGKYPSTVPEQDGTLRQYTFVEKPADILLGEFGTVVGANGSTTPITIKLASDNYFDPASQANAFEATALRKMRADGAKEYWETDKATLYYARALVATADCLRCHGEPSTAPSSIRQAFPPPLAPSTIGGGYGYSIGQTVGVLRVAVPHRSLSEVMAIQSDVYWVAIMLFITIPLTLIVGLAWRHARQIARLGLATKAIANGDGHETTLHEDSASSLELYRLLTALKAAREAVSSLMSALNKKRKPQ